MTDTMTRVYRRGILEAESFPVDAISDYPRRFAWWSRTPTPEPSWRRRSPFP